MYLLKEPYTWDRFCFLQKNTHRKINKSQKFELWKTYKIIFHQQKHTNWINQDSRITGLHLKVNLGSIYIMENKNSVEIKKEGQLVCPTIIDFNGI